MQIKIPDKDVVPLQIVLDMARESFDFSGDNEFYEIALDNLQRQLRDNKK